MGSVAWAGGAGNGQIPANLMVDVGGGMLLNPAAAGEFYAWAADYKATTGRTLSISEAYRNLAMQEYYWNLYQSGRGNVAAVPGTSSHGQGLAVDVNSGVYDGSAGTTLHQQLVDAGHRHNWSWELVGKPSGEAWHFNYVGDPTQNPGISPNGNALLKVKQNMFLIPFTFRADDGNLARGIWSIAGLKLYNGPDAIWAEIVAKSTGIPIDLYMIYGNDLNALNQLMRDAAREFKNA